MRSQEALRVYVNGEARELSEPISLAELSAQLDLPAARIAVERNLAVVRRSDWSATALQNEDRIEIVHFVGGGSDGQDRQDRQDSQDSEPAK
jgi:thiazole synthase